LKKFSNIENNFYKFARCRGLEKNGKHFNIKCKTCNKQYKVYKSNNEYKFKLTEKSVENTLKIANQNIEMILKHSFTEREKILEIGESHAPESSNLAAAKTVFNRLREEWFIFSLSFFLFSIFFSLLLFAKKAQI